MDNNSIPSDTTEPFFFNPNNSTFELASYASLNPLKTWDGTPTSHAPMGLNPSLYQDITFTVRNDYGLDGVVTFSERFGPSLETIYGLENGTINTDEVLGSSSFVNILGTNFDSPYGAFNVSLQSVLAYDNTEVSSYYSESLSYQVNITNLTAALNSVANTNSTSGINYGEGQGLITATVFSWYWYTTQLGWAGSQVLNDSVLVTESVNSYLVTTFGDSYIITNSTAAGIQLQNLIQVETNDLETAQTYLDNASTNLESQISLAGTIINSLQQTTFSIIKNI